MIEPPLITLTRWEESGGVWRTRSLTDTEAIVDLCSCSGEPVGEVRSGDLRLLSYLARRPRSDPD
jgi:hypothetical protein